jgi:hypothetical protein
MRGAHRPIFRDPGQLRAVGDQRTQRRVAAAPPSIEKGIRDEETWGAMSHFAELRCRCGQVEGRVRNASATTVNHVVCYCDDCQAFAQQLGRADALDAHGGSDIVQVAPASLEFVRGTEQIAGLRLGPRGLYRFYATCCSTPLGNTLLSAAEREALRPLCGPLPAPPARP